MRTIITPLLVATLLTPILGAQQQISPDDRKAHVACVKKELADAETALFEKYQKAKDDAEREVVMKERPDGGTFAKKLWPLVTANPADDAAAEALAWMMRISEDAADKKKATELLFQHHVKSEAIADVCASLAYQPSKANLEFVERVAKETPHDAVRGQATWAKVQLLGGALRAAESITGGAMTPEQQKGYEEYLGAGTLAWLKMLDGKAIAASRETLLEEIATKFADVKAGHGTLGEAAKAELFELRNLAIGKAAPDIVGKDADGVQFKLSDYRGKVVLLDFWGEW
ncbi:MAG: redoxin domain-containing protein [Planctomycetes bacterium]|nr:redoxin domain-containing protein [Planctomycetota bacterium]